MRFGNLELLDHGQLGVLPNAHEPAVFTAAMRAHVGGMIERQRADGVARADALDSLIATRDMEQILAEILRDVFGPRYSERYIPIGTMGAQPWADVVIQRRVSRHGMLDYVTSADMPWIQVTMQEIPHTIRTLGARFGWSWIEMQRAAFGGAPLRTELALATAEAASDTKDLLLIEGDTQLPKGAGFIPTGLINDLDVPITAPGTGTWATATAAQIIADVSGLVVAYRNQSRRANAGARLLIPEAQFGRIETLQLPNTESTVRTHLLRHIDELQEISVLPALAGAGVGAVDRALLYAPDKQVLEGVVPMDFSFILEEAMKLRTDVLGLMRMLPHSANGEVVSEKSEADGGRAPRDA
jgi:hypothetical protein